MSLRAQAHLDLLEICGDVGGFSATVTLTAPTGEVLEVAGPVTDIGAVVDPETGAPVATRAASVALPIASFVAAGLALPRAEADLTARPWRVTTTDANGQVVTWAVARSMPDRELGLLVLQLELLRDA